MQALVQSTGCDHHVCDEHTFPRITQSSGIINNGFHHLEIILQSLVSTLSHSHHSHIPVQSLVFNPSRNFQIIMSFNTLDIDIYSILEVEESSWPISFEDPTSNDWTRNQISLAKYDLDFGFTPRTHTGVCFQVPSLSNQILIVVPNIGSRSKVSNLS